jgi:hypothetical protein
MGVQLSLFIKRERQQCKTQEAAQKDKENALNPGATPKTCVHFTFASGITVDTMTIVERG